MKHDTLFEPGSHDWIVFGSAMHGPERRIGHQSRFIAGWAIIGLEFVVIGIVLGLLVVYGG